MAPEQPPIHPIATLRQHTTNLEAAITLALADPNKEPVHRLRTSTRRIEAQLQLLELLPGLPDHARPAKRVRKLLKELRQAAGSVRDLDVQRKLIKDQLSQGGQLEERDGKSPGKLRKEARELRRALKRKRRTEAGDLLQTLKLDQKKLAPALEDLLDALSPAEDLSLSAQQLSELTRDWYQQDAPPADGESDPDTLHAIRKSAKLARYIAESADSGLAQSFESLQEAGGTWHDLLTLAATSRKHLGARSRLTASFAGRRDKALATYRQALQQAATSPKP